MTKSLNKGLHEAKKEKNDEYYTQISDIEKELRHYKEHFKDKVVFCNCDTEKSNFVKYFKDNFEELGLKKLLTNGYNKITQEGDFRSPECIELLKQSDIVVTNPPFSLFREYVEQLIKYDKKFLIVGNPNAITYKEIFKLIKENKLWLGNKSMGVDMLFDVPVDFSNELVKNKKEGSGYRIINGIIKGRAPAIWFTNLEIKKRHEDLILYKSYNKNGNEYSKYDNYDAINVDKTKDIPIDYKGVMGVPISFMDKYNPEQFEILGSADDKFWYPLVFGKWAGRITVKNKQPFKRLFIKNKKI